MRPDIVGYSEKRVVEDSIQAIKKRVAFLGNTQLDSEDGNDTEISPHDCRHCCSPEWH